MTPQPATNATGGYVYSWSVNVTGTAATGDLAARVSAVRGATLLLRARTLPANTNASFGLKVPPLPRPPSLTHVLQVGVYLS